MKSAGAHSTLRDLALPLAGSFALGCWVARDSVLQNPGLTGLGWLLVFTLSIVLHAGLAVTATALLVVTTRALPDRLRTRVGALAIGLPLAAAIWINLVLRLGDRLPGTATESPKALLYGLAAIAVATLTCSLFAAAVTRRARLAVATTLVAAGVVLPTWTDTWPSPATELVSSDASSEPFPHRVLLVAIDGLDWGLAGRLAAAGDLPVLRGLLERGVAGPLQPVSWLSPIAWTSAATGVRPLEHGVLSFTGYELGGSTRLSFAEGVGDNSLALALQLASRAGLVRRTPGSIAARQAPALWDIATDAGRRVAVVNWLIANPAQALDGYFVSPYAFDEAYRDQLAADAPWMFPGQLDEEIRTTVASLRASYPDLQRDEIRGLASLRLTARLLAADVDLDLVMTYSHLSDGRSHEWERHEDTRRARRGPSASWTRIEDALRAIDLELGELVTRVDDSWLVLLVSDHGWNYEAAYPGHVFPVPAGAYLFCCETVPEFDTAPGDFWTLDIAPTVLGFLQIPIAENLRGQIPFPAVRTDVVRVPPYRIAARWPEFLQATSLDGATGDARSAEEFLERLRALGYVQ